MQVSASICSPAARLNGFETFRVLRRPHGTDLSVRMWIRSFDGQPVSQFVVVVIVADAPVVDSSPGTDWQDAPAVVGMASAQPADRADQQ